MGLREEPQRRGGTFSAARGCGASCKLAATAAAPKRSTNASARRPNQRDDFAGPTCCACACRGCGNGIGCAAAARRRRGPACRDHRGGRPCLAPSHVAFPVPGGGEAQGGQGGAGAGRAAASRTRGGRQHCCVIALPCTAPGSEESAQRCTRLLHRCCCAGLPRLHNR